MITCLIQIFDADVSPQEYFFLDDIFTTMRIFLAIFFFRKRKEEEGRGRKRKEEKRRGRKRKEEEGGG